MGDAQGGSYCARRNEAPRKKRYCQAQDCGAEAVGRSSARARNALCRDCSRRECVLMHDMWKRFCQSCKNVHPVTQFSGKKTSCEWSLKKSRDARRKQSEKAKAHLRPPSHPQPPSDAAALRLAPNINMADSARFNTPFFASDSNNAGESSSGTRAAAFQPEGSSESDLHNIMRCMPVPKAVRTPYGCNDGGGPANGTDLLGPSQLEMLNQRQPVDESQKDQTHASSFATQQAQALCAQQALAFFGGQQRQGFQGGKQPGSQQEIAGMQQQFVPPQSLLPAHLLQSSQPAQTLQRPQPRQPTGPLQPPSPTPSTHSLHLMQQQQQQQQQQQAKQAQGAPLPPQYWPTGKVPTPILDQKQMQQQMMAPVQFEFPQQDAVQSNPGIQQMSEGQPQANANSPDGEMNGVMPGAATTKQEEQGEDQKTQSTVQASGARVGKEMADVDGSGQQPQQKKQDTNDAVHGLLSMNEGQEERGIEN